MTGPCISASDRRRPRDAHRIRKGRSKVNSSYFRLVALALALGVILGVAIGAPPASATELILPHELEYLGSFRFPGDLSSSSEWPSGGGALTYYPHGDPNGPDDGFPGSLYAQGHNDMLSEVSIPVPSMTTNARNIPQATTLRPFTDPTGGIKSQVGVDSFGGVAYVEAQAGQSSGKLYWAIYEYYNAAGENYLSHGMCDLDFSNAKGAWRLGSASDETFNSMKTANYVFDAPADWADANVGGRRLMSGRHRENGAFGGAQGPAIYAYAPWQSSNLSYGAEIPATCLLMYPTGQGHFPGYCAADYWTGAAFLGTGERGAVLIVGSKGLGESYYGDGDASRCVSWKGFHCDPYEAQFLFYSPDDLAAVARGQRQPWEVVPYATVVPDDMWPKCRVRPEGTAYDRSNGLLYVIQYNGAQIPEDTGTRVPLVHVWRVSNVPLPPPPPDDSGGGNNGGNDGGNNGGNDGGNNGGNDGGNNGGSDGGNNDGSDGGSAQTQGQAKVILDPEAIDISPNPFTDTTTITMAEEMPVVTRASVHDLTGRLVYDFGPVSPSGIQWNSGSLGSGVYFLRIQTPTGSVTKKVSLVK